MKLSNPVKLLICALLTFIVIFTISKLPGVAEWYAAIVYPIIAAVLSFISSLIPFSLFDILSLLIVLGFLALIVFTIIRKLKIIKALYILAYSVIALIVWFYVSWGFCYFRYNFYERCNVEKAEYNVENYNAFAEKFVTDANVAYVQINDIDKELINNEIERQYERLKDVLKIKYPNGKRRTKQMTFQIIQTRMGITGYFGPFFNEVHVNNFIMPFEYPYTLAHEKAHQFGVASEAECNLYAFIVCATSTNPQLKYSAYVSEIGRVVNTYIKINPENKDFAKSVRPEIINDLQRNTEHWRGEINKTMSDAQSAVYDAYLKTNKISSGVKNYSEVIGLLVSTYSKFVAK